MRHLLLPNLVIACFGSVRHIVSALQHGDADAMYKAFNNVFLISSGSEVFYQRTINDTRPDMTWPAALDILGAEDAYERTGDADMKHLINNLLATWLQKNPPPWNWDGWNDDIGWFTLALIRGYQMTGNKTFLDQATYGFNYAFHRGWDTKYDDGGIWEEQPRYAAKESPPNKPSKSALANDSLGKVAGLIFQSTRDPGFLVKSEQIYHWVRNNIFNASTGQIYTGVDKHGHIDTGSAAYNQGTFLDFANLLFEITGNKSYFDDANRTIEYAWNNLTVNGIFSNSAGYLHTWADELARGIGHFVGHNGLWDIHYSRMLQNADSIMANRRTDLNITWNAWDRSTPIDSAMTANNFVSAMTWLQFSPAVRPDGVEGTYVIMNQLTGLALTGQNTTGFGNVIQSNRTDDREQCWLFTPNSDGTWNIINTSTWQSLDYSNSSLEITQSVTTRGQSQRWYVDKTSDGTFNIKNQASGLVLQSRSNAAKLPTVRQQTENHKTQQRWNLDLYIP